MSNSDELIEEPRKKINIDPRQLFSDSLGDWCLACPVCEGIYTHVESVFTRIGIDEHEAAIYKGTKVCGKTDERRSALVCVFRCENDCRFELVFQQHKGNNHIEVNCLKDALTDEGPEVPDNFAPMEMKPSMARKPMETPTVAVITTAASLHREAAKAGVPLLRCKEEFNKAYLGYFSHVAVCNDQIGFCMLEKFRRQIKVYVFDYKRGNDPGVKHACREMFRLIAVEKADYTMAEMESFVQWYDLLTRQISNHLADVIESRGDDAFGDLCDSLPLAGSNIVKKILADGFKDEESLEQAITTEVGPEWAKFILHGENYIEMALRKQAKKWFLYFLQAEKDNRDE